MKKSVLPVIFLSTLSLASTAQAEQADNQWFWGANISSDSIDSDIENIGSEKATGFGLFVGKQFNEHWSVMGGYKKFGSPTYNIHNVCVTGFGPSETICRAINIDLDLNSLYVKSRLKNTFDNGFMVFADIAINSWNADATASYAGYAGSGDVSGNDFSFGAGVGYQNDRHEYTLGFESYDFDGTDITSISVSYSYSF
ncbi:MULTISPECIES: outer membrane beta-barrel protein [Pseudoalteromonas]|uniref:Outer membrane protein beta-barrel domain-containing protein n=1 Tax=Pseudoalteromonas amylolytica TaxID=1859457 RepID=A0A1S1N0D2_9GAMM|nr:MULTISPECIES: outer membrane beta-barrel protein [Pseudoalteromonas]OHU88046.1 hypothetical protein BFC16_11675 [Pseudoalteromonas sp. JW3]OHU91486.1 hypothetical protein BET10_11795 [Pseudoalteromonas amylolytica]